MTLHIRSFYGVAIAVLVLSLIASLTHFKYEQLVSEFEDQQAKKLLTISKHFEYRVAERELILNIASEQIIKNYLLERPEAISALLDKNLAMRPDLAGFLVTTASGSYIASSSNVTKEGTPNLLRHPKTKEGFQRALETDKMAIGKNYYFKPLNTWVAPFRKAIRIDGKVIAMISTGMNIRNIRNEIDVTLADQTVTSIVSDHGYYRIFSSNDDQVSFEKLYSEPVAKTTINEITDHFQQRYHYNLQGIKENLAKTPLTALAHNGFGNHVLISLMYEPKYAYWVTVETPYHRDLFKTV
ncbi:cache domain-containing protein [Thiomicrorhabdus sediminis]|uniref:Cache domain-containing protein n=1 Tax=Thiomicrorhabdus sediminis TaxID=2580412 RepID=A0A4P9K2V2_9GAMM|nr:PDC sensor domain-containing protein [Thiomicrorhabdus sediminis]QCU89135.1 hypothetical protein FE785_00080 [Thiomicrorhabdus sediminis]